MARTRNLSSLRKGLSPAKHSAAAARVQAGKRQGPNAKAAANTMHVKLGLYKNKNSTPVEETP